MPTLRATVLTCLLAAVPLRAAEVPEIQNPQDPPLERTVQYEEVWRAGDDENAEYLFGVIQDADEDADGNVYLLDSQLQELYKFDAEGHWLGRIARKGEGPGEIDWVYQFGLLGEGRIGLMKVVPSSLICITTDGLPLDGVTFDLPKPEEETNWGSLYTFDSSGDVMYGQGQFSLKDSHPGASLSFFASFAADGTQIHRFWEVRGGYDFSRPIHVDEEERYLPGGIWAADAQGRLYHATGRDDYVIEVREADGTLLRRIRRDWEVHRRSDEEKEEAKNQYSFSSGRELPPISYDMSDTDPAIGRIQIVGDELWVSDPEHVRQGRAEGTRIVDVFDLDGHLLERRTLVFPHDDEWDATHILGSGRIARVKNFRSASLASQTGSTVQRGEERVDASDAEDDFLLEVIVYAPRP